MKAMRQNKEAKACQEERRTRQQERDEDKEIRINKSNSQISLAPFREVTRVRRGKWRWRV